MNDGNAYLEIRDYGKVIPPERQHELKSRGGGVGLRGIRERIAQFGGQLEIRSNSMGTTVVAIIPSNPSAAEPGHQVA